MSDEKSSVQEKKIYIDLESIGKSLNEIEELICSIERIIDRIACPDKLNEKVDLNAEDRIKSFDSMSLSEKIGQIRKHSSNLSNQAQLCHNRLNELV